MSSAAGILLGAPMEQGGIGDTSPTDRGLTAVAKERRTATLLAIHGERSRPSDKGIGCIVTVEPHAVTVEQAHARLLDDLGWHAGGVKAVNETRHLLRQRAGHRTLLRAKPGLDRKIPLPDPRVCSETLNGTAKNDLSLVDHSRLGCDPETEVHVLLGNENGCSHIAQAPKKFTNALHDDGGKPLAGLVQQERNRVPHQRACD